MKYVMLLVGGAAIGVLGMLFVYFDAQDKWNARHKEDVAKINQLKEDLDTETKLRKKREAEIVELKAEIKQLKEQIASERAQFNRALKIKFEEAEILEGGIEKLTFKKLAIFLLQFGKLEVEGRIDPLLEPEIQEKIVKLNSFMLQTLAKYDVKKLDEQGFFKSEKGRTFLFQLILAIFNEANTPLTTDQVMLLYDKIFIKMKEEMKKVEDPSLSKMEKAYAAALLAESFRFDKDLSSEQLAILRNLGRTGQFVLTGGSGPKNVLLYINKEKMEESVRFLQFRWALDVKLDAQEQKEVWHTSTTYVSQYINIRNHIIEKMKQEAWLEYTKGPGSDGLDEDLMKRLREQPKVKASLEYQQNEIEANIKFLRLVVEHQHALRAKLEKYKVELIRNMDQAIYHFLATE